MVIVISPAKTLNFHKEKELGEYTFPLFLDHSSLLIEKLRQLTPDDIASLMKISEKLAHVNYERIQDWHRPFTPQNAKAAILAFTGDVYEGLNAREFDNDALAYAQGHLRILSGLYGILRPLDLIQPYRLEMGLNLKDLQDKDLYSFWRNIITDALSDSLKNEQDPVLINLASREYFKSINGNLLNARIITPVFKEKRGNLFKIVSFSAKKARGLMTAYIIKNRLKNPEDIKSFHQDGYAFNPSFSTADEWIFTRSRK